MNSPFTYAPITRGSTIDAGVILSAPGSPGLCGRVDFYVGSTYVGTSSGGPGPYGNNSFCMANTVLFNTAQFAPGAYTVMAIYHGDASHTPAQTTAQMTVVTAPPSPSPHDSSNVP
ncbi:MAG: hypothetical protein ACXV3D_03595 [Halobacteriota archaeon]